MHVCTGFDEPTLCYMVTELVAHMDMAGPSTKSVGPACELLKYWAWQSFIYLFGPSTYQLKLLWWYMVPGLKLISGRPNKPSTWSMWMWDFPNNVARTGFLIYLAPQKTNKILWKIVLHKLAHEVKKKEPYISVHWRRAGPCGEHEYSYPHEGEGSWTFVPWR